MNPELLAAIKERVALGHSKEAIHAALEAAGYNREQIDAVYSEAQAAQAGTPIPLADGQVAGQFAPGTTAVLPAVWPLFKAGWSYMLGRLDLVALLAVPLLVLLGSELLFSDVTPAVPAGLAVLAAVATALALVGYMIGIAVLLRVVCVSEAEQLSISDALPWVRSHALGLLWVVGLTVLVILGGSMLFIIPGIIVSFYVYFAQYVYVVEDARGMSALLRSAQLVRDNWWALVWRLFLLVLCALLLVLPVGLLVGAVSAVVGLGAYAQWIAEALVQLVGAGVSVIAVHVVFQFYRSLAAARPVGSVPDQPAGWKYKALAVLGVFAFGIFLAAAIAASQLESELIDTAGFEYEENEVDLEAAKLQLRDIDAAMEAEGEVVE